MVLSRCTICKTRMLFAFVFVCVCSQLVSEGAGCYVPLKKRNLTSLQKMFLHLAKQEYNSPELAELFQDILERHNRIVRKHSWHLECRSRENGMHSTCLCSALLSAVSLICLSPVIVHTDILALLPLFSLEDERELLMCSLLSKEKDKNISVWLKHFVVKIIQPWFNLISAKD